MALDPFLVQDPVDPEPVQPRFLDDDDRKDAPRPGRAFSLSWDKRGVPRGVV
jgi:hypothetical protein